MTTALPPAGWYDDPERDDHLRWWDGSQWSDVRQPRPEHLLLGPIDTPPPPDGSIAGGTTTRATRTAIPTAGGVARSGGAVADEALASPGERLAAAVVDTVISFAIFLIAGVVGLMARILPGVLEGLVLGLLPLVAWGLIIAISVMGHGRLGQSYGKHLIGIAVVSDGTGGPIGSGAALGREIIRVLGAYVLGLGVLWILWDPRRQGWHDKAVSSVVVSHDGRTVDPLTFLKAIVDDDPDALAR